MRKKHGFSIVEVALALAIASIILLAIFAMIYVAQTGTKASSDDTRLSQISQQVFHQVQIDLASNAAFTTPSAPWVSLTSSSFYCYYYFDAQGSPLPFSDPAPTGAMYRATAQLGVLNTYPINTDSSILKSLVITITWPPAGWPVAAAAPTVVTTRTYPMMLRNRGSYGNASFDTPP